MPALGRRILRELGLDHVRYAMSGAAPLPDVPSWFRSLGEAFTEDGFLRTGDTGELDELGRLRITGRVKERFKTSKGEYVAPAPIENLLGTHPEIDASLVTGVAFPQPFAIVMPNAQESSRISAEPEARGGLEGSLRAHLDTINAQLDPHERCRSSPSSASSGPRRTDSSRPRSR